MKRKVGLALGCGGVVGYAWSISALKRFEEQTGWDPRTADVLVGTSAGSVLASLLGSGTSAAELVEAERARVLAARRSERSDHLPPQPVGGPLSLGLVLAGLRKGLPLLAASGFLPEGREDARRFLSAVDRVVAPGAWVTHPRCWVVATDVETGERVAFGRQGSPKASLHDAIGASCAVPGWIAPVDIGGRRYLDGGTVSSASVDLLVEERLDEIIVVSPMTSARFAPPASASQIAERLMRAAMTRVLDAEIARAEAAGITVTRIEPTARDLGFMGPNFMDRRQVPHVLGAWT